MSTNNEITACTKHLHLDFSYSGILGSQKWKQPIYPSSEKWTQKYNGRPISQENGIVLVWTRIEPKSLHQGKWTRCRMTNTTWPHSYVKYRQAGVLGVGNGGCQRLWEGKAKDWRSKKKEVAKEELRHSRVQASTVEVSFYKGRLYNYSILCFSET